MNDQSDTIWTGRPFWRFPYKRTGTAAFGNQVDDRIINRHGERQSTGMDATDTRGHI
ncbi:MAG: hypothetical protein P1T08_16215 [Acidimicrobiia bacterium]|nr:hypothetical protein [Acidimicrobiia bacterium]